jgi:hypothetical protein
MECQYCKNIFVNINNLKNHQKTAKYCLKLRNKNTCLFKCQYCNLSLSTNQRLQSHTAICAANSSFIQSTIQELKAEITSLKSKITSLEDIEEKYNELLDKVTKSALEPKRVTNNNINNNIRVFSRTEDEMDQIYKDNMTINHIIGGLETMAKLTVDKVIKDTDGKSMILITDKSRQNAVYKAPTGETVKDFGLKSFTNKAKKSINKTMYPLLAVTEEKLDSEQYKKINEIIGDTDNDSLAKKIVKLID